MLVKPEKHTDWCQCGLCLILYRHCWSSPCLGLTYTGRVSRVCCYQMNFAAHPPGAPDFSQFPRRFSAWLFAHSGSPVHVLEPCESSDMLAWVSKLTMRTRTRAQSR